jgi:hypothetical protein
MYRLVTQRLVSHQQITRISSSSCNIVNRSFATRRTVKRPNLPPECIANLPNFLDEEADAKAAAELPLGGKGDPTVFPDNPVTSAHCIDTVKKEISTLDSVIVTPTGQVVHGRYGVLGNAAASVPLEYLALLKPAAEGAAALRVLSKESTIKGTMLIYGASQASGIALAQLASASGNAVVGVIDGEHSGNEDMIECVKGLMAEPGTALPEEFALSKKLFIDLVHGISTGDEGIKTPSPEQYLEEFKKNFFAYVEYYPDTRPAAVSQEMLKFEYMEKDREHFDENMAAFLEQYPPGSPPMDEAKVNANFDKDQYEIFRNKFWYQTSDVISGGEEPFSAPHIVKQQSEAPESLNNRTFPGAGPYFPYSFSVLNQSFPPNTGIKAGGPILGAAIVVTKTLQIAMDKVFAVGPSLRAQGEALHFLSRNEKAAYNVARCIINIARNAKAPVVVLNGSIPTFDTIVANENDVQTALNAMDIRDDGTSSLNYFVQAYRGNDFPFYADYAVHIATEPLAGPRQIIVTK